ncbi:MarR family winged helix-turn-helix transcriptional regulator [Nonomuraea africana]|uniref:DNA-binding MarR family transcriptional regulator n=1 Tax=Nonomuraea africana TaxID=46171 RepID=A0ABR9K5P8_9ACTN|nr:hypothetical protein [Nonomuraea africana]MBE1557341.1 DNA-binding MarR family transcriptional regulator [Nonomuraea africana]
MATAGLLTRRRDEKDHRLVRLYLTEKGQALREPVTADREFLESRITAGLSDEELTGLTSALRKVLANARRLNTGPLDT